MDELGCKFFTSDTLRMSRRMRFDYGYQFAGSDNLPAHPARLQAHPLVTVTSWHVWADMGLNPPRVVVHSLSTHALLNQILGKPNSHLLLDDTSRSPLHHAISNGESCETYQAVGRRRLFAGRSSASSMVSKYIAHPLILAQQGAAVV